MEGRALYYVFSEDEISNLGEELEKLKKDLKTPKKQKAFFETPFDYLITNYKITLLGRFKSKEVIDQLNKGIKT